MRLPLSSETGEPGNSHLVDLIIRTRSREKIVNRILRAMLAGRPGFWTTLEHPDYLGPFGQLKVILGHFGRKTWPTNKALKILLTTFLGTPGTIFA